MTSQLDILVKELNEKQRAAVENPLESCTKIVAGAGTGKTKIISKRFAKLTIDLINKGINNPTSRILVITFTDKAANEMKERIFKELDDNGLNSYQDEMWISTFHGFCNKILRKHSLEANLTPDFELAEDNTLSEIYKKITKAIKYNETDSIKNIEKICSELNIEKNLLSIENLRKLSSINSIDNIFDDIFKTIKKIKSLGLTPKEFLDTTLQSTKNFSKTLVTLPFNNLTVDDYVINWENHLRPYIDSFCKFEKDDAFAKLCQKSLLICKNRSSKAEKWTPAESFLENIQQFEELEIYITKVIALIYAIYQQELENVNIADFDDLINKTIFILKNNKIIRSYYQKFFEHLIIDEFQDTNGSQLELIKLLLKENYPNITFVGDRKQSIYGFRYAQMENLEVLHNFIKEKYNNNSPEIKLDTNYRSTAHVLKAVNYVTTGHLNLDEELSPNPNIIFDEENKFVKNSEISDCKYAYQRKEVEAKYFAQEIQRLCREEKANYKEFAILVKSHSQSELIEKVLTKYGIPSIKKTNKGFFTHPTIKNAVSVLKLIKNPLDELALTRILKISNSDKKLLELKLEIDNAFDVVNKNSEEKRFGLCGKILKLYEQNQLQNKDLKIIYDTITQVIKEKNQSSLLKLFNKFEQKIKLHKSKNEIEEFQNENTLRVFEKIISDYEQGQVFTTVKNFLEYFDKISDDRNFELPSVISAEIDAVQIMTVHASKGLEFPYTFVCSINNKTSRADSNIILDLQYGKKPGFGLIINKLNEKNSPKYHVYKEIWKNPRELNEAIRVFYVAVSRAKKYLNVITFQPQGSIKPADYTLNFPNSVEKEAIIPAELNPQPMTIAHSLTTNKSTLPVNILPDILSKEVKGNYSFSFSKLNTFEKCANKFLLKYKYCLPSLDLHNKGAEVGTIVHKLISNTFVFEKITTEEEIDNYLIPLNIDATIRENIKIAYRNFLNCEYSLEKLKEKNFFAEKHFDFNYQLNDNNIRFIGDIDLLVQNEDETYSIIDFKTNTNIEADKGTYYKQLYLYKQAIENEGLKVKECLILSLNNNSFHSVIKLDNEALIKSEFDKLLVESIESLESNRVVNVGNNCKFCEYKYICEFA